METLSINELRTRAAQYGNRLNHCVSNKEEFDITLKILDSLYKELIEALQEGKEWNNDNWTRNQKVHQRRTEIPYRQSTRRD